MLAHGTTVATNALLERRGARTALVTTEGFRDVIEIGRQNRASLYDLTAHRPAPLVPRELRFTVRERMGPDGRRGAARRGVAGARGRGGARGGRRGGRRVPALLVPASGARAARSARRCARRSGCRSRSRASCCPEFREYERCSTTVANAYLGAGALGVPGTDRAGAARHAVLRRGGRTRRTAAKRAAACVLSGPAAGVVGAAFVAGRRATSSPSTWAAPRTDVAAVLAAGAGDGRGLVAGVPIRFPTVDVHTIGAGGGSIAWLDEGGALRVGPRSAGARPGPACYGRGGDGADGDRREPRSSATSPTAPSSAAR